MCEVYTFTASIHAYNGEYLDEAHGQVQARVGAVAARGLVQRPPALATGLSGVEWKVG